MSSHQKACVPCAAAKRRCVPQTPQCPRCAHRGIKCHYKNQPLRGLDVRSTQPRRRMGRVQSDSDRSSDSDETGPASREIVSGPWAILSVRENHELRLDQDGTHGLIQSCPIIATPDNWAMDIVTRNVKSWHENFMRKLETPFIHMSIYDAASLPLPLEEAFSVCAAYVARTDANKAIVMSIVERRATAIIERDPSTMSMEAHLASLQAFLLLHTIQLWDGDAEQRTQVEGHASVIESWAMQLHTRLADISSKEDAALSWDQWVLHESVRRTVLITMFSQGVYELNKFGVCSYVPTMAFLPFTTDDGAWTAKGPRDWAEKGEQRHGAMDTYLSYSYFWKNTTQGSPSAFGRLLLTPCLGSAYKELLSTPQGEKD
ncbi:Uu.00g108220.m01.CDS01 [Anthostomella pinea]|uniref:Uu.00g108220.m01.CDS01 n=1 Tax=Anthostomella pinea TaxID=933095 RepID=A0AAI8VFF8_9PEZI|nr:Uu.00g108220.m01.CDS01 [Anthostomella pinea]